MNFQGDFAGSPQALSNPQPPPPKRKIRSLIWPILAILVSVGICVMLVGVAVTTPPLTDYGPYTPVLLALYTTVSTIIATIVTAFIMSQERASYLHKLDDKLSVLARTQYYPESGLKTLGSSWRTILGIGELREAMRNLGITAVFLLTSLIIACITSGFTPTITTKVVSYSSKIPSGDQFYYGRPSPADKLVLGVNTWDLHNGSYFLESVNNGGSPAQEAVKLMGSINIADPSEYACIDEGVAVHSSAIGTPLSIYTSQGISGAELTSLLRRYGGNVPQITACVPVMVRNPFKCRKGGVITLPSDGEMLVTSDDGTCNVTGGPADKTQMVNNHCEHGGVGQSTILLGATNTYAEWLYVAVGEKPIPPNPVGHTFSIQCDVDARNAFEYRNVVLVLSDNSTSHVINRRLRSTGPCTPSQGSSIGDALFATAATANHFPLNENALDSGWFRTINEVISRSGSYGLSANDSFRAPPWAFNDSRNALEDVFGITAGLVTARIFKNSSLVDTNGTATISFTRVGPGHLYALIYAVPPLLCALILLYLLVSKRRYGDSCESSRLEDLIDLGKVWRWR